MKNIDFVAWGATSDRLMKEDEAAEFLTLKPATLRQWRSKNLGPLYQKLGGRVAYRLSELVLFVEAARKRCAS